MKNMKNMKNLKNLKNIKKMRKMKKETKEKKQRKHYNETLPSNQVWIKLTGHVKTGSKAQFGWRCA